jgi:heme O synthase-like polyprenyltransferase
MRKHHFLECGMSSRLLIWFYGVALLAFQVPLETWEKNARPLFIFSLMMLVAVFDSFHRQRGEWCEALDFIGRDEFSAF